MQRGCKPEQGLTIPILDEYLVARRAQGYTAMLSPNALAPLVQYLRGVGLPIVAPPIAPTVVETLLCRFHRYLTGTRGLSAATARRRLDTARRLVAAQVGEGDDLDWAGLKPASVTGFVLSVSRHQSVGSTRLVVDALRSFLRFLYVEGVISHPLGDAIPAVAGCRLAGLPRSLEPDEVRRLLSACDRRTRFGRRDFAILMLLVRLGLRATEVRLLELTDIDWRAGELLVRGKGDRFEHLPLPAEVGQALAAYLQRGRPVTAQGRTVFVCLRAPHRQLSSTAVTATVVHAAARAGLGRVGAHRLRHTAATNMVRSGVALIGVAQVLRHRLLATTAIYAKVDRERLRLLARPWPGGAS